MKISIRKAFKDVMSEKYDKTNIAYYYGIAILSGICSILLQDSSNIAKMFIGFIAYIILSLIASGMFVVASNNYFTDKNSIFPSITQNIAEIFINSLKYFLGSFVISFAICLSIGIIVGILSVVFPLLNIIIIPAALIAFILLFMGLLCCFIKDMEVKSWFNFPQAFDVIKNNFTKILIYIAKSILIGLICVLISGILLLIFLIFYMVFATITSASQEQATLAGGICGSLLGAFTFGTAAILGTSLLGQLLNSIYKKDIPAENNNTNQIQ